jgi:hypothetical protein
MRVGLNVGNRGLYEDLPREYQAIIFLAIPGKQQILPEYA